LRVVPMMMPELMDEWFESEFLQGAVSAAGIHHITLGPFAAATGYSLLHQHIYSDCVFHNAHFIRGGTGNLAETLLKSAESVGVEIRTHSTVQSIDVANGICSGVTLEGGEIITAAKVVSGLDPTHTFIRLVGPAELNPSFFTQIRNIKYRGSVSRIHFALNSLPEIKGVSQDQMEPFFP